MFCMALFLFGSYVLAAGTETWYTDFSITSPTSVSTQDGQTTWTFEWSLTNHDIETVVWQFYFVDAVPLWSGYYACKADNQSGVFGQYLQMDGSTSFSINPWETITWTVNFDFPASYSGTYHGCIVYSVWENLNNGDTIMNMTSRKAIPVHVQLQASKVSIHIVANLGSRGNSQTCNNNGYESMWKLLFYPSNHALDVLPLPVESWYVVMDRDGYGELVWVTVLAGNYDVVYKWWHHLASYIKNVTINEWDTLDFVLSALWVWEFENEEQFRCNSWWSYQIAWDLPSTGGTYDYLINGTDLSVLYSGGICDYLTNVSSYDICDLNNDGRVDSSDASVIIANDWKTGVYYRLSPLFTGFGMVDLDTYMH